MALEEELRSGAYQPGAYHYFKIHEPKERLVAAAPFRDRVVHHAIVRVIQPIFEKRFIEDSFASRPGKGTHAAMRRAATFELTAGETNWYFDIYDNPPWDTWVEQFGDALVAWTPHAFHDLADHAVNIECVGMLMWLDHPQPVPSEPLSTATKRTPLMPCVADFRGYSKGGREFSRKVHVARLPLLHKTTFLAFLQFGKCGTFFCAPNDFPETN